MMKTSPIVALFLAPTVIAAGCGGASAASAVQKECSTKYQAAKAANGLNGQTYQQFYKRCAAQARAETGTAPVTPAATPVPTAAPASPPAAPRVAPPAAAAPTTTAAAPVAPAPSRRRAAAPPSAPAASGNAVFPTAVSAEFSKETPGKARLHTCLAQYKANKADNGNGGLRWIQTGGGYYSECNNRLKG